MEAVKSGSPKNNKRFTSQQMLILIVSIFATFVSMLDAFIVNVALPAIEQDFGGGLWTQQWVVNAYFLTLGALMLLAGSMSDIFGRKRILTGGLIGFGIASLACALAPNAGFLIISRAIQGAAGAFLVPSSLALIMDNFSGSDKGEAIGKWTAWTVAAAVIGPLLGGFLTDTFSWRYIFAINVVPIAVTLLLMSKIRTIDTENRRVKVDILGAIYAGLGLGGVIYGLIEQPNMGWQHPLVIIPISAGILLLGWFIRHEQKTTYPMLPLKLFLNRNFGIGNIATIFIYGALSLSGFLVTIFIQQTGGYSAFAAGLTFLPVTIIMFFASSYFGRLSGKFGPRIFMSAGPIIAGIGFLLMLRLDETVMYWTDLFPGVVLFGFGLAVTVAPLTTAILGSIDNRQSGIGSAVNNAVSRIAGLLTIAVIGIFIGPQLSVSGFHSGLWIIALMLFMGGIISAIGITNSPINKHQKNK